MVESLLATKLFIPPLRPGLVNRPRLLEKMQAVSNSSLTLVSAPAGFGKTTLLSEWIHHSQPPVSTAWLSLEEGENDPTRFWEYFIAALKTLQPKIGETALSFLHSFQPLPIESALIVLINDLAGIPEDSVLVLDDYHFIKSLPIHKGIAFLIEHLPPKMHLVIATRADPPLPLSHFRGRGTMAEIGTDDLRFTSEEAVNLLREMNGPELSFKNLEALNTRTEGWAVGLKMALLSLPGEKDIDSYISNFTGSQRYIMDYLIEEVLDKQPEDIKEFPLKTSILERLSGPLCDAITGNNNGRELLLRLEKENLFLVPLDLSREWYRYEHLFAELLKHRLEVEFRTEAINQLYQRASQWYEQQKLLEDSIHYTLKAQDWEKALRLISNPSVQVPKFRTLTMYNWLRLVPEELLRTNMTAYWNYIWGLELTGQYDAAETHLKYLEQTASKDNRNPGGIDSIRAAIAVDKGDLPHAEEYARRALSLLPPADARLSRAMVSIYLGVIYMYRSQYDKAEPLMTEAYEFLRQTGDTSSADAPLTWLGLIAFKQGKLFQAEGMLKDAIGKSERNLLASTYAHLILVRLYYEWNDLERATLENDRAVELTGLLGGLGLLYPHINMVRIRLAQGDTQGAMEELEKAELVLTENQGGWASTVPSHFDRAVVATYHVALAVAQEDAESTSKWEDKVSEFDGLLEWADPYCARRLLYLRKGKEAARERLQKEYEQFIQRGLYLTATAIRLNQVLLADTSQEAMTFLAEALTRGKSMGLIRTFVDEGTALEPLLRKAISQGIEPEYAKKMLDIIEAEERQRRTRKGETPASLPTSDLLSERELEVLKLLAEDKSNEQIAAKLSISLNTVKTHVSHILDKLGVKDRSQAVFRGKELKLL